MDEVLFICYLRTARRKARTTGIAEAVSLLRDLHAKAPTGGPRSDQGGLFWITVPSDMLEKARTRLPRLGYTYAVDLLEAIPQPKRIHPRQIAQAGWVRWRGQLFKLNRLYEEDVQSARNQAPDRRTFAYHTEGGEVRLIRGYRGGGDPLNRRGLPVCDARMLVNLVFTEKQATFLDPFAGIGGITLEASEHGYHVVSCDQDTAVRHGLSAIGSLHCVANACQLPFGTNTISAIATEPPYHPQADTAVNGSLMELQRVLIEGGRMSMLCASRQAETLQKKSASLGLVPTLDSPINRKGVDCTVLAWEKK